MSRRLAVIHPIIPGADRRWIAGRLHDALNRIAELQGELLTSSNLPLDMARELSAYVDVAGFALRRAVDEVCEEEGPGHDHS
jgi:hypothetical protein